MANRNFYGSINITDLMDHLKEKHSAFVKGQNGKIYCNISVWLNEEPDQYDNIMSIKLSATKEAIEKDKEQGKIYIGNCKENEATTKPINTNDSKQFDSIMDGLPF
jgi:hypothetical protein